MAHDAPGAISPELDELSCDLIGEALDVLADSADLGVVATVLDDRSMRLTCSFDDDGIEACLMGARDWVRGLASGAVKDAGITKPVCYAIAYLGAVDMGDGFADALVTEFGDKGNDVDYSAYTLLEGVGEGDGLRWGDPAPAGELEPLL